MSAASWNASYQERPALWSGEPNAQLLAEVAPLPPGKALDVGCGEGADAVWLAARGWQVTAVDISSVALERARTHANAAQVDIDFIEVDLTAAPPLPASFDLVSAQFFQLPNPPRNEAMIALSEAVSPGGHLLVVGHHPAAEPTPSDWQPSQDRLYRPDEITALVDPAGWVVMVSETRERTAMHHGKMTDLTDAVVLLRRI